MSLFDRLRRLPWFLHGASVARAVEAYYLHFLGRDFRPLCDEREMRGAMTFLRDEFDRSPMPCPRCAKILAERSVAR